MFKYTKAGIKLIVQQFKLFAKIFKFGFLLFTIAYYTYAILTCVGSEQKLGNLYVNIALLSIAIIYGLLDLFVIGRLEKKSKKTVKRSFKWLKFVIRFIGLGFTIYALYSATSNINVISIILVTLSIILWVIQVLFEIIVEVLQAKAELLIAGWKKDIEDIKKPVTKVGNFFRKIGGKEIPESDIDQSKIDVLDSYIVEEEEKKNQISTKKKK